MALSPPKTPSRKAAPKKAAASGHSGAASADAEDTSRSDAALPGKEEIAALQECVRSFATDPRLSRARYSLERLAQRPPQVLLMEGGSAEERLAAAHYWSLLLNCPQSALPGTPEKSAPAASAPPAAQTASAISLLPGITDSAADSAANTVDTTSVDNNAPTVAQHTGAAPPCLECPDCVRMLTHLHRDCFFYDGAAASIKIDDVRALRAVLGEPPREARYRVVIFREAQALVEAAANALLKSFEEPRPGTSFVMLAPQRERLLATLVSRSLVLTLPWPSSQNVSNDEALAAWEDALCAFLLTGKEFLEKSGARGAVDAPLAHAVTNMCRRAFAAHLSEAEHCEHRRLRSLFAKMPAKRLRILDEVLAEAQDSLTFGVNPTLVLEWLATRLFFLYPRS